MCNTKHKFIFLIINIFLFIALNGQKAERNSYNTLFNSYPIDTLKSDMEKYERHFNATTDRSTWILHEYSVQPTDIHIASNSIWIKQSKPIVTQVMLSHDFEGLAYTAGRASFSGEVLIRDSSFVMQFKISQDTISHDTIISSGEQWQKFNISIPYQNTDIFFRKALSISFYAYGTKEGEVSLRNLSMKLDDIDLDIQVPLPSANRENKFDNNSYFDIDHLTDERVKKLEELCLFWGFLKYYHPTVIEGYYNWNTNLFNMLPLVLSDRSMNEFYAELYKFIPVEEPNFNKNTIKYENTDTIISQIKMNWMSSDLFFNKKIKQQLKSIRGQNRNGLNYAVGYYSQQFERITAFRNETTLKDIHFSDTGYRLLSLFRFWNMMYYFHPQMSEKENYWLEILPKYIKQFAVCKTQKDFDSACMQLVCELKDSHTDFYGFKTNLYANGSLVYDEAVLPVSAMMTDNKLFISDFETKEATDIGLKIGDRILKVNGRTIEDILNDKNKFSQFENINSNQIIDACLSFKGEEALFEIERGTEIIELSIKAWRQYWVTRLQKETDSVHVREIAPKSYYINLSQVSSVELDTLLSKMHDANAIVFDVREYPKESSQLHTIANFLLPEPVVPFYYTYADLQQPGVFRKNPYQFSYGRHNPDNYYKGKVIALVNRHTMSLGEIIAEVIRSSPNAITLGEKTTGVLGNVSYIPFTSGNATRYTSIGVYYQNDDTNTFGNGIRVDKEVQITRQDMIENQDALLNAALSLINIKPERKKILLK